MQNRLLFQTQSSFISRCISICSSPPIARRCRPPSRRTLHYPSPHLDAPSKSIHHPNRTTSLSLSSSTTTTTTQQPQPRPTFSALRPPLHPATLHALTHKLKHVHPTEIQIHSYLAAVSRRDVLARARTGTGKTLAFLLPALENALRRAGEGSARGDERRNEGVRILILCPTRELAMQIHSTSQSLAASHSNSDSVRMHSQVIYGGVSKEKDVQKMEERVPFVLVATPGRLLDHLEGTRVGGRGFGEILGGIRVLVLDEADRCLDMGFQKDMQRILQIINQHANKDSPRQTLLFSATIPPGLREIMASALREDYITVDCIEDVDPTTHTNETVDQTFLTLPDPNDKMVHTNDLYRLSKKRDGNNTTDTTQYRWISGLVDIVEDIILVQNPTDYKLVVFFPTTSATQFFSYVFNTVYKIPVIELHSGKHQSNRTSSSKLFRGMKNGILFTTDVSARGVDYPDVTHVIQYGPAENRETYIHRLGRTARAGKKGMGILVLGGRGEERTVLGRELKGLDVKRNKRYQDLILGEIIAKEGDGGGGINGHLNRKRINEKRLLKIHASVGSNSESTLRKHASAVYRSMLGYYANKMKSIGMNYKVEVVEYVNKLALQMGFRRDNLPRVSLRTVQNIGLQGIRGLNVGDEDLGDDEMGYGDVARKGASKKPRLRRNR